MAKQTINIGSAANDGTGSSLRAGGDLINDNFNEIYTALGDGSTLSSGFVTASSTTTFTNKTLDLGGTGNSFTGSLAEFNTALQGDSFVSLTGSETLTNKTLTTPTIAEIDATGDFTIDATTDIVLDADGADVILKDAGTEFGRFTNSSTDFVIESAVSDKDIIFKGDDGGSGITSLTLDMSNSGAAIFSAAAYNAEATLTDASTVSWNAITQPVDKVTLGGNRTIGAASGGVAGAFVSIVVIQDGTGSRTVSWNAAYEFASDTAPTLTTTASKGDLFVFRYNGSKWLEVGRNLALTLS